MRHVIYAAAFAAIFAAHNASAQKSEDTIRIGMAGTISTLSTYHDSTPASHFLSYGLFDTLIAYDERSNSYQPLIATAWKRTDDRTLEFEIREDAKWHDGSRVDVDDVIYTLDWLSDPATRLQLEYQWEWIDHVEKLGRTKLRLIAKRPVPYDLARLAMHIPILPEHKHGILLGEKYYFGRSPIGSGPYKFVSVDHTQATVQRVDTYRHGGTVKPLPKIARVQVTGGWDYPNRITEWRAGKIDMLLDADPKLAPLLAEEKGGQVTTVAGYGMLVLFYNARRPDHAVGDGVYRQVLNGVIDRDAIESAMPAGGRIPSALCWPEQAGCGVTVARQPVTIEAARATLVAMLRMPPEQVKLTLAAQGNSAAYVAEIVAQSWRALGVTVHITNVSPEEMYMAVRDRTYDVMLAPWHAGSMPDVYDTMQRFFAPGFWDLHEDPGLHDLEHASSATMDDAERRAIVTRALTGNRLRGTSAALAPLPAIVVHRPDVAIDARGRWQIAGFNILDLSWR